MSILRFPSLSQLLGLGRDTATTEPAPEWVHPYPDPHESGEEYRARYLTHTTNEGVVARMVEFDVDGHVDPTTRPLYRKGDR
ncbi:hypothetical protein [Pseudactinotalea sp. Z1732]|uniref:hypothetical protein n=1 Tax=Pseudactinotalea sp. Z1732 TaxID=3413026 RepID=UPI003C7B9B73